jgi:glutamine synthetase
MLHLRNKGLEDLRRKAPHNNPIHNKKTVDAVFGENVFGDKQLKEKLHSSSYKAFRKSLEEGAPLSPSIADEIAEAMKDWALSKGATHFTHWFQPLTGLTAEKHDSFISFSGDAYNRKLDVAFSGKQLIKGEPDASSFPHGGIRSTFEARGYTAWDMESPSFIREGANGAFLCVPSAFASWTGEALDMKTPLLRSGEALSAATKRLINLLGKKEVTGGYGNLGIEQEFFLIDRGFYIARPDLVSCGRTLLGAQPPKGQQMEDHYFGSLDRRVLGYIQDVEWHLWRLGVPTTTRHNEVAPSQYEMAPIFESIGIACDHNMMMMEVMKEVAREHDFACLLHEKPFAGVNGSGKHNNWSVSTNTGENLMDPGTNPKANAQFMVVLAAVVRMVHLYGDLMRASISQHGNDFRLGANEAPPAVMSIYVGDQLWKVIDEITTVPSNKLERMPSSILLGTNSLPPLPRDLSDRNRTSPFAFTGNKFEFRAVGSSQACARPTMILNTIMSDSMQYMADEIEAEMGKGFKLDLACNNVVTRVLKEHSKVVFNGNGYSEDWIHEAEKRGLPNLRTGPEAIKQFATEKNISVFERMKVLSRREVESQQHILYETYSKTVAIEADCLFNMISSYIIPACLEYKQRLIQTCDAKEPSQEKLLVTYSKHVSELLVSLDALKEVRDNAKAFPEEQLHDQATYYRQVVMDQMLKTRAIADVLEAVTDDKIWPFPKYSEILFLK